MLKKYEILEIAKEKQYFNENEFNFLKKMTIGEIYRDFSHTRMTARKPELFITWSELLKYCQGKSKEEIREESIEIMLKHEQERQSQENLKYALHAKGLYVTN